MKLKRLLLLLVAPVLSTVVLASPAYALSSKDIEKELMCQCGCTMVVNVCDCDTANQIRAKISELMDQGQGKDQIIAYFVGQYGEKMLAAPTKKGFNLVAWVVPFAAVVVAGGALFFILRAWARRGKEEVEATVTPVVPVSANETEEYRWRLEEELKKYKEEGPA